MERPLLFYIMLTFFSFLVNTVLKLLLSKNGIQVFVPFILLFLSEALPSLWHLSSWILFYMAFNMRGSHQYVCACLKCNNGH